MDRISWLELRDNLRWNQGEHVSLIGHTGSGKTTLASQLLPIRKYVTVIATKPKDPLLDSYKRKGYSVVREWPPPDHLQRILFWPKIERISDKLTQAIEVHKALSGIYRSGGWCLFLDEVRYIAQTLKLKSDIELLWLQGRSSRVSLVAATQRPSWVPLEMYSQATHLFLWRETDRRNLNRVTEISSGLDTVEIRNTVSRLSLHDFLYINTRDNTAFISNLRWSKT